MKRGGMRWNRVVVARDATEKLSQWPSNGLNLTVCGGVAPKIAVTSSL